MFILIEYPKAWAGSGGQRSVLTSFWGTEMERWRLVTWWGPGFMSQGSPYTHGTLDFPGWCWHLARGTLLLQMDLRVISPGQVMHMFICICWVLRASRVVLVVKKVLIAQLCPSLCDRMDYRLPGSSVHEILQARILEWVAMPSSRWSSRPGDRTQVSCIADRLFTVRSTRETSEW